MLEYRLCGVRFRLSLLFPAVVIVMLTQDTSGLSMLCLIASLIHECGHVAAMLVLHDRPQSITLGVFGMRIERRPTERLSYPALCAVSLAGPMVNAVCAVILPHDAALVHTVLALFHALPIVSLDGGEALYALLCCRLSEERAERVLFWCSAVVVFPLAALGFWVLLADGYNFTLLLTAGYLILRMFLHQGH